MAAELHSLEELLRAGEHDPVLGIHAVTEFMFCPRAGVIAHESEHDDLNALPRSLLLRYLPRYDLTRIEEQIGKLVVVLAIGTGVGLAGLLILGILALAKWPMLVIACWAMLAALVVFVAALLIGVGILVWRRTAALGAPAEEPTFTGAEAVPIAWWGLRAAGWAPRRYPDGLSVAEWKLVGRPWLVLCKGDERAPVFLMRSSKKKLYQQHYARMAGYCELLQRATGCQCRFGLILFVGSYRGLAAPNTTVAQRALVDGVRGARRMVHSIASGLEPAAPANNAICFVCPLGRPKIYRAQNGADTSSQPNLLRGRDGRHYHSACGDRFQWTPHHAEAYARGLVVERPDG